MTEEDAAYIVKQLLSAITYCHSRGVVHRDPCFERKMKKEKWKSLKEYRERQNDASLIHATAIHGRESKRAQLASLSLGG